MTVILSSSNRSWWRSWFREELEILGEARCFPMVESLDADLVKDLRGLGKPPTFDGNEAQCQDFRFIFRIHMSLVSSVSRTLMDTCETERNQITLAAVKALGEVSLECCVQVLCSSALITRGSVRTLECCYSSPCLEHPRQHQEGTEQVLMMTTGCKLTLSLREGKERRQRHTQIRKELAQGTQMSALARTVVELDIG